MHFISDGGMVEKYDNEENNQFSYILENYKIFSNLHIKTMFKKKDFIHMEISHYPNMNNLTIFFENNIMNHNQPYISLNNDSYKEHILIHLHTRSIDDLILKAFSTGFAIKHISYKNDFVNFINKMDPKLTNESIQIYFLEYIGLKAQLPFVHCKGQLLDIHKLQYNIFKFTSNITDSSKNINISNCLKNNEINESNYTKIINKYSNKLVMDKTFIK